MYLTDIRGFTAEEYSPMCKITIHGMGIQGDKGLTLHFAKFCRIYHINPRFISVSDMGIAFFILSEEKEQVLESLCEYFPIWV